MARKGTLKRTKRGVVKAVDRHDGWVVVFDDDGETHQLRFQQVVADFRERIKKGDRVELTWLDGASWGMWFATPEEVDAT